MIKSPEQAEEGDDYVKRGCKWFSGSSKALSSTFCTVMSMTTKVPPLTKLGAESREFLVEHRSGFSTKFAIRAAEIEVG